MKEETSQRTQIRLLRREDNAFESISEDEGFMTKDQRWNAYIASYVNLDPTEGVRHDKLSRTLLAKNYRHVMKRAQATVDALEREESENSTSAEELAHLNKLIHHESLPIKIDPDQYILYFGEKPYGEGNVGEEWWCGVSRLTEEDEDEDAPKKLTTAASVPGEKDETNEAGKSVKEGDKEDAGESGQGKGERNVDDSFDTRYVNVSSWMQSSSREEIDEENRQLQEIGVISTAEAVSGDTAMEG